MKARFGPSFVYRRVCIGIGFKKGNVDFIPPGNAKNLMVI